MSACHDSAQQGAPRSPVVAFGLQAATAALKAKSGALAMRDRLSLVVSALEWVPEHDGLRVAVLEFIQLSEHTPRAAGEALQLALDRWLADLGHRESEGVLDELGLLSPAEGQSAHLAWTSRKDCGHD